MSDFYATILLRDADEPRFHVAVLVDTDWDSISSATSFPGGTQAFPRATYRRYYANRDVSLYDQSNPAAGALPGRIYKMRRESK